jgi:ABC-2 type transport system permease protein
MSAIFLVARRDYFAYVGAWGFWLSLICAPLIILVLMFSPLLLAKAEPPRVLTVLAQQHADAATVTGAFEERARREARAELNAYIQATAPQLAPPAMSAYDAAPDRARGIVAARAVIASRAPRALGAFPNPAPRYQLAPPPAPDIHAVAPYLDGTLALPDGRRLYGALNIRRESGTPAIEYWSVNLSQDEPSSVAAEAMRLAMRREALMQRGVSPNEAERLESLEPQTAQFDPRPAQAGAPPGARVTLRERAPFYAALALAFVLWSVVFSVANMLLTGVLEEKSNKILDTLLTSVSPIQLLTGKLLGVAAVSLTLFLFWGAVGGGLLQMVAERAGQSIFGQLAAAFLDPRLLTAFGVGFIAGYLMYGAIFVALGSLCESTQEAQTLIGPIALILALPMVLIAPAVDNPNAPIISAASWFPLFTPFLLLVRAPAGLSWLEIAGMSALMAVSVVVILMLAARIFKAGVVDQVSLSSWRGRKSKG